MGVNRFGHGLTRRYTLFWLPWDRTCLVHQHSGAEISGLNFGSSARTRTWNLVVTSAPKFLLGLDYLFTLFKKLKGGCRALPLKPGSGYELAL